MSHFYIHDFGGCGVSLPLAREHLGSPPFSEDPRRSDLSPIRAHSTQRAGMLIPGHGFPTEIRLVGHVAGYGGMVSEYRVLSDRHSRLHCREEISQVRLDVIPIRALKNQVVGQRLPAKLTRMLFGPCLHVSGAHCSRETVRV